MSADFDSILEQCISQVSAGKARIQSCLLAYPSLEDDLEPLLRAAAWAQSIPIPELSPEANARIEARLFQKADPRPRFRLPSLRLRPNLPARRWALAGLGAVLIVAIIAGMAAATTPATLPGSPVYPVKLAAEQAWLWLSPADEKPEIHLRIAERRLQELQALADQDAFDSGAAMAMMVQVDAALEAVQDLPPVVALPVLQEADRLNRHQEQLLTALLGAQPAASRHQVEDALQANTEQAERTQALFHSFEDVEPPTPTEEAVPPGQTKTPEPPGQTKTPQSPARIHPAEQQEPSNPQVPPGQIKTPKPPGQIKTPEPPGQVKTPKPEKDPRSVNEHKPDKEPRPSKEPKD